MCGTMVKNKGGRPLIGTAKLVPLNITIDPSAKALIQALVSDPNSGYSGVSAYCREAIASRIASDRNGTRNATRRKARAAAQSG